MGWLVRFLGSSIGRKQLMALTGLGFCAFLCSHLVGNSSMFFGGDALNAYAHALHSLGPVITVMELAMLALFGVHILMATLVWYGNLMARPQRYAVSKRAGGATLSSTTMPYTGALMLVFVVVHLINFHFVDHETQTVAQIVAGVLTKPGWVIFYMVSMVLVALHVRHGFWSAFQTIGANHPKYMPAIALASLAFGLLVALGYGSLPLLVWLTKLGG